MSAQRARFLFSTERDEGVTPPTPAHRNDRVPYTCPYYYRVLLLVPVAFRASLQVVQWSRW